VRGQLQSAAAELDTNDRAALAATAEHLHDLVRKAGVPDALRRAILDAYHGIGGGLVAVRSSATAEDTAGTSFAGMNQTFTNVDGDDALVERVVACWESLFGERVLSYRATQGVAEEAAIAVVVQRMVDSPPPATDRAS
jgi:pyruvate,water dikinase